MPTQAFKEEARWKGSTLRVKRLQLANATTGAPASYIEDDGSGNLKLFNSAGTGASLNATELAALDGITAGTVAASKAVVVDANKDATEFRNLGADRLDLGAAQGASGSASFFVVRKAGIADNTATAVLTVTVPNAEHNAGIFLDIVAHLGVGTDLSESTRVATGAIAIARKTGDATVAVASTLAQTAIATTSGGATLTLAYAVSAMTGAAGATQTFDITVTLVVTGTISNHVAVVAGRLVNSAASGITIAASA